MERFLADLLGSLARDGVRVAAVVHEDRRQRRARRAAAVDVPGEEPRTVADAPATLYRAPALGRLLYAPVSPRFPLWLRRALRAERPDVLHLHLPNTSAFWALLLPEARRIPWVVHWHADVVSSDIEWRLKLAYPVYRLFEQWLLRHAAAVVATSPPYLAESRALASWRDKSRVVPLGLDPTRISKPAPRVRKEAERLWGAAAFRILAVGRLTYYKGFEYLLRALPGVAGARAVVVGEGERRRYLQAVVAELGLDERAVLAGGLPVNRLHALMETCHCLCLPSIERTEAFGMVLLEAMAHGKPVVVCDIKGSGVSWVVRDGETGMVVAPADPLAIRKALRTLSDDPAEARRLGECGRRRYQGAFHIDRVSRQITELYNEVCDARTKP